MMLCDYLLFFSIQWGRAYTHITVSFSGYNFININDQNKCEKNSPLGMRSLAIIIFHELISTSTRISKHAQKRQFSGALQVSLPSFLLLVTFSVIQAVLNVIVFLNMPFVLKQNNRWVEMLLQQRSCIMTSFLVLSFFI